ncbi:minor capsid protein [Peptoniphilus lacrimalis]|uniref:NAD(+)--arginine ADP-ribosyltransferase EFV n=1 Tax=Peptoniphilus lacrimalis TaxID=33031 RepID=A0A379C6I4_9FIRM|nr:minor capsid protein [Peptoniphilus lacrimalis]SUB57719.1 NAD(+)--arginine ADP-ribosyltransferase EFV [Peptoniphilus lacrimalis]
MTDYWKNRFIKSTKDVFDSDEEYVKEIFKIYERTIEDIDGEIFKLLSAMEDVSMAEAKKLLNKYEIRSFKSGLDEFRKASKGFISPNIEQELDIISRRVRISRLQAMQVSMKSKVASLLNEEQKKLFDHLSNNFTSSYYKDLYELQRITGYKNINSLSKDFVNNILNTSWTNDGENFSDRIWKRKDKLLATLDTDLRQGLITGKRPDEITKVISDKLEVSKSNAKRLVLTESSAIHSQSRKAMYERMGVEKYEVVATLDLRTSNICRNLDGKVFDVKDYERGVTAPPYHVYCRSTTVPYYNDDIQAEIENTRMARDPETGKSIRVEDLTYKEWYDKYVEKLSNNNQGSDMPNEPKEPRLKYTEAETNEAIEEYVSGDGMWINNKLRGIGEIADYPLSEDDKIYLEKLDQATQGQIVKEKTLYRSVDISSIIGDISDFDYDDLKSAYIYGDDSKRAQETLEKYLKHIKGKEIIDKGFMSTTKDKEIALDFQGFTGSSKPCVIEFNVPNGVHGIDLKEFDIADMEQKEVLLARNQKFVIREVRQEQGQFYFKADLIPNNGYNRNIKEFDLQLFSNKDKEIQTDAQLKKGINSDKKNIEKHKEKINNPQKYYEDWKDSSEDVKNGRIKHWEKEISNFKKNIQDAEEELKKRGEKR